MERCEVRVRVERRRRVERPEVDELTERLVERRRVQTHVDVVEGQVLAVHRGIELRLLRVEPVVRRHLLHGTLVGRIHPELHRTQRRPNEPSRRVRVRRHEVVRRSDRVVRPLLEHVQDHVVATLDDRRLVPGEEHRHVQLASQQQLDPRIGTTGHRHRVHVDTRDVIPVGGQHTSPQVIVQRTRRATQQDVLARKVLRRPDRRVRRHIERLPVPIPRHNRDRHPDVRRIHDIHRLRQRKVQTAADQTLTHRLGLDDLDRQPLIGIEALIDPDEDRRIRTHIRNPNTNRQIRLLRSTQIRSHCRLRCRGGCRNRRRAWCRCVASTRGGQQKCCHQ